MDANGGSVASQNAGSSAMNAGGTSGSANNTSSAANQKLRKRTKTGCLTCRKRRIKCGEERPVCGNCVKSKRVCEGYNQRVVWKPPIADWPGLPEDAETLQYHSGMLPHQYRPIPPPIDTANFTPLRARAGFAFNELGEPIHFSSPDSGHPYMQTVTGLPLNSPHTPLPPSWTPITPHYGPSIYGQGPLSADSQQSIHAHIPTPTQQMPTSASSQFGPNPNVNHMWNNQQKPNMTPDLPTPVSSIQQDFKPFYPENYSQAESGPSTQAPQIQVDGPVCWWEPPSTSEAQMNSVQEVSWATSSASIDALTTMSPNVSGPMLSTSAVQPVLQSARLVGESYAGVTARLLEDAAVEYQDDDYYDVQSDEEMDITPEQTLKQLQLENKDLSLIRSLHQEHMNELNMRRYDTFIYSGMLDHYRAEQHANPLRNPKTARVFAHFIFATGPSLSIFERHPRNPSAMFTDAPPDYQQGLWTYTLPMMAIKHQGLLHAMLALSSLHIAKLQGTSITPSYKHYSYAIKRIHRTVGISNKKLLPTTIAATLLLGFYEVLTADHLKWSSHLAGAKQLLIAIPFKRMTKEARKLKAQQVAQTDQFGLYDGGYGGSGYSEKFRDLNATIDESLVSVLMGRQLRYDQFGQVLDDTDDGSGVGDGPLGSFDLSKYELYQDLYWWYARQDVYQAILSGNKLLLDFNRWADCPPRASMGRQDAVHGTHDHLIILLARIAEFNSRDRRRKIKIMEANGGQWRPPPGMQMPSPPGGPGPQSASPPSANPNAAYMNPPGLPSYGGGGMSAMPRNTKSPQNAPPFAGAPGIPPYGGGSIPQKPPSPQNAFPFVNAPGGGYGGSPMPRNPAAGQPVDPYRNAPGVGFDQGHIAHKPSGEYGGMGASTTTTLPMHPSYGQNMQNPMAAMSSVQAEHSFDSASPSTAFATQPGYGGGPGMGPGRPGASAQGPPPRGPPPSMPSFYGMAPLPTTVNMPSSYASSLPHNSPSPKSEKSDYDLENATQNALQEWSQLRGALNTFESHLGPHYQPLPADLHPPVMTPFGPALFYRSHDIGTIWAIYNMACIIAQRCHPHMPPAAMMAAGIAAEQTREYATRIGQIIGGIVPPTMGPDLSPSLGACLCETSLPLFFAGIQYREEEQRHWLVSLLRNVELRTGWKSVGMVAQGCETAWEKAFEMGRGPPYKRTLDAWHFESAHDSRVAKITGIKVENEVEGAPDYSDKKWTREHPGTRVHWAMGLLSVEEDEDATKSRHVSGVVPEAPEQRN